MVKHTKTELKRQKDLLKRFKRYLPTLQLKQQQLQLVIRQVRAECRMRVEARDSLRAEYDAWVAVFADTTRVESFLRIETFAVGVNNIAGVDIPVFQELIFQSEALDPFHDPLWLADGIELMKRMTEEELRIVILEEAIRRLEDELRVTTQRVNLFEKVRIPETEENIRVIRIFLSDVQTAEVVRGKIAKRKILERQR